VRCCRKGKKGATAKAVGAQLAALRKSLRVSRNSEGKRDILKT
jgi:hypothetical protein